ncbi:MAG TPA: PIN domain-containing protein [Thermoanaerobaculia bacterium]|nr:PIN domain-containing protein [Thermoanaerobaculia bacterium]
MIFVDTSVWIAAFRVASGLEATHLRDLLDADEVALAAPVRIEILIGSSLQDRPRLRRVLSALPTFYPVDSTWVLIDSWLDKASKAGEQFGFADLLIAALAAQQGAAVWSLDGDFRRMADCGLVPQHLPSSA